MSLTSEPMTGAALRHLKPFASPRENKADSPAPAAKDRDKGAGPRKRRESTVPLEVRLDPDIDFDATAKLADEGFGFAPGTFRPNHLRWLYEEAFSDGTTVLGAYAGDRKVGHIALVHHSVAIEARIETAVALIDLFILPPFRSRAAISGLYGAVEALCVERGIRFIVAMPNEKAAPVNRRHLNLADVELLDIRVGLAWPLWPWPKVMSHRVRELTAEAALPILASYCDERLSGLRWTGERLWSRLQKPDVDYALHPGERVMAVSAPRSDRKAPYTLICALLPRPGMTVRGRDVASVIAAACRTHRKPLFVYTGLNTAVPKPGVRLPKRLRPSQMILQIRDFSPGPVPVSFDRFEPLDFDFC